MANAIIELTHLVKKFGKQTVLEDINLTVQSGEIVGLIGPSGAGKSTVIKTTLGMEVADGGSAKVFNAESGITESNWLHGPNGRVVRVTFSAGKFKVLCPNEGNYEG